MKKRILSVLLVLLMVVSLAPVGAFAEQIQVNPVEGIYPIDGGELDYSMDTVAHTIEIVRCSGGAQDVVVPSEIEGCTVIALRNGAFESCLNLKSVELPDSVTSIGNQAFKECVDLHSINFSANVTSIGDDVFYDCDSLMSINVEEGNTAYTSEDGILFDKEKTTLIKYPGNKDGAEYVIPDSVTKICDGAFQKCKDLQRIDLPENITSIGKDTFERCESLTSIEIPDGVTDITDSAFRHCYALKTITLPKSLERIGRQAFAFCENLTDVYYAGSEAEWENIDIDVNFELNEYPTIHFGDASHTHHYKAVVTKPTCTEGGYTTYTCSVCGDSYESDYKDALGHDYKNGTCTRCGAKEPGYQPQVNFTDVQSGEYYYSAVQWAVANKITTGVGDNKFDPNGTCTRAQVVTFLWRAAGEPKVNADVSFTDVKPGEYYYEAVKWAVANNITTGVGNNKFDPNGTCTRAQVVTFQWRAAGETKVNAGASFTDVKAGEYYNEAVKWAVANNITTGVGNNKFDPNATCTRGQVVTFLYRAE